MHLSERKERTVDKHTDARRRTKRKRVDFLLPAKAPSTHNAIGAPFTDSAVDFHRQNTLLTRVLRHFITKDSVL